jgi:hypothetical protein
MKNSRNKIPAVLLGLLIMLGGGCYYDNVIFPDAGDVGEVNFSADILPLFENDCATSGCHNTGGQKPDLTPVNAYTSLTNGNYINTSTPEESEVYLWMKGLKELPMPPSGTQATNTAKVLAWIKQGAPND